MQHLRIKTRRLAEESSKDHGHSDRRISSAPSTCVTIYYQLATLYGGFSREAARLRSQDTTHRQDPAYPYPFDTLIF
jgi:hypothetical protein